MLLSAPARRATPTLCSHLFWREVHSRCRSFRPIGWIVDNSDAVKQNDFTKVDGMPWDSSVQALTRFPDVIQMLSDHLDWTESLGMAFSSQPEDVANVIQMLRAKAENVGNLKSTPEQVVTSREESGSRIIYIAPANPERIYVPVYDSSAVFTSSLTGALIFGTGVLVGSTWNNRWGWNNRAGTRSGSIRQYGSRHRRIGVPRSARAHGLLASGARIVLAVAPGPIVPALGQIVLARADPTVPVRSDQTAQVQVGLTGPGRFSPDRPGTGGPISPGTGRPERPRRAGPSGREIGPRARRWPARTSRRASRTPNRTACRPPGTPCPPSGRPISGAGTQARNNVGMQDHNNGLDPQQTHRPPNGNKAARDLNNAHALATGTAGPAARTPTTRWRCRIQISARSGTTTAGCNVAMSHARGRSFRFEKQTCLPT